MYRRGSTWSYRDEFEIARSKRFQPQHGRLPLGHGDGTLYQGQRVHTCAPTWRTISCVAGGGERHRLPDTATVPVVPPAHLHPNAFTRTGMVSMTCCCSFRMGNDLFELELRIYDRWGEPIFQIRGRELVERRERRAQCRTESTSTGTCGHWADRRRAGHDLLR